MTVVDDIVTDWNTDKRDRAIAAVSGNAALKAQIEAEIARLEDRTGRRRLLETDEVSRRLHRVLKALLAATA